MGSVGELWEPWKIVYLVLGSMDLRGEFFVAWLSTVRRAYISMSQRVERETDHRTTITIQRYVVLGTDLVWGLLQETIQQTPSFLPARPEEISRRFNGFHFGFTGFSSTG